MPAPEVLVLADDLTGALEVGALFAASGLRARVGIECAPQSQVAVVDLESRHLDSVSAAARIREFARNVGRFLLVKIDSTMRGPIASQLNALAELFPNRPIFFNPAYPKLGRTVVGGRLYVNGTPLHETAFARDPTHPVRTSDIAELLGEIRVHVQDAASDDDLARIAEEVRVCDSPVVVIGSGGLIRHLVAADRLRRDLPRIGKPLVVCGSLHAISTEQIRRAGSWPVIECSAFPNGRDALAAIARQTHERIGVVDTLIVFGGDTARALMQAFEVRRIEPIGEALPGIPVSRIEVRGRELMLITKAGGFGTADLLPQLAAQLEAEI